MLCGRVVNVIKSDLGDKMCVPFICPVLFALLTDHQKSGQIMEHQQT